MQTDISELEKVVEGILFVSGQGVEIDDICEKLELEKKVVLETIDNLIQKHKEDGINIIKYKNSVQMCSNPKYADDIATVLNPIREKLLTKATLETAAIVAYKQPVTRLDIEQIRGCNSDYALQVLTNFKLIDVVGRKDAIGKPLLYGTTDEFLKRFGLENIEDLPDYDELLERIKLVSEIKPNDSLYGSTEIIPEEKLPDSVEKQENLESKKEDDSNLQEKLKKEDESQIEKSIEEVTKAQLDDENLETDEFIGKDDFDSSVL